MGSSSSQPQSEAIASSPVGVGGPAQLLHRSRSRLSMGPNTQQRAQTSSWARFKRMFSSPGSLEMSDDPAAMVVSESSSGFVLVGAAASPGPEIVEAETETAKMDDLVVVHNEFIPHAIITDQETIRYILENHTVIVMRGLSGSGKSTLVKAITDTYNSLEPVVCSADHYFINKKGEYKFDASQLKQAHEASQNSFKTALKERQPLVIVDNTNVMYWEMQSYFREVDAQAGRYRVVLVEPATPWRLDAKILSDKNSHGVPAEVLTKKVRMYKSISPSYYAWFMNKQDSQFLLRHSLEWLENCLSSCPQFEHDFARFSHMLNLRSQLGYFNRDECLPSNRSIVHCTAKYCGRDAAAESYVKREDVRHSLGQVFDLRVIGYVITKNTFGARINLSEEELSLYGQDDDEKKKLVPRSGSSSGRKSSRGSNSRGETGEPETFPDFNVRYEENEFENRFYPIPGKGRRAHITLGTSEGVAPVTTGLDVVDAVRAEAAAAAEHAPFVRQYEVDGGVMRQYEKGLWVLYPDRATLFQAMFTGHYI